MLQAPPRRTASRRAIEALRAGVPNRYTVRELGCDHPEIERRFGQLLEDVPARIESNEQAPGFIVSGDFGTGKSHLLEYLQLEALERNFVCSKLVISKETSLADPVKLFRASVEQAQVPNKIGPALEAVTANMHPRADAFRDLYIWADSPEAHLAGQFPATLYLWEKSGDAEFRSSLLRFWAGDPVANPALRAALKEVDSAATYDLQRLPPLRALALQRFRFVARLIIAAGYSGWILLIDEAELIGQYSLKQRARAYGEVARWLGHLNDAEDGVFPGMGAVMTFIPLFEVDVIRGKNDEEMIPGRLRASGREEDALLAAIAERGMRLILGEAQHLTPLNSEMVENTYRKVRGLYSSAFDWEAPAIDPGYSGQIAMVMRLLVRRWITEWDILRLFPGSHPATVITPLAPASFATDPALDDDDKA